jgi:hypothetical protein
MISSKVYVHGIYMKEAEEMKLDIFYPEGSGRAIEVQAGE